MSEGGTGSRADRRQGERLGRYCIMEARGCGGSELDGGEAGGRKKHDWGHIME